MRVRAIVYPTAGFMLLLCGWEIAGHYGLLGKTFPPLSQVLHVFQDGPRRALLMRSAAATTGSALAGLIAGSCLGIATALMAHLMPLLRIGLDRLAVLVNALPVIALAPILIITVGREDAPAALASIPVFFLLYVATRTGLRGASAPLGRVLTTLGASPWQQLAKVEAFTALPSVLSGMRVAASSAMIGAIVGEWFGAPSGLGLVVLNSMQNFQIPLLWATVIAIAAITLSFYGLLTLGERAVRRRIGECDA
jgi:ABC-type nitrate/sulfonate/bicarbonate transport system permease component